MNYEVFKSELNSYDSTNADKNLPIIKILYFSMFNTGINLYQI